MKHKKKYMVAIGCIIMITVAIIMYIISENKSKPGESHAKERIDEFTEIANADNPEELYPFLTEELRGMCSKEEFIARWEHEKTYPYLIPYWIFYREFELEEDLLSGTVTYERAARLAGQFESYGIVYENKSYYFEAFETIVDGSYIEIFERLEDGE